MGQNVSIGVAGQPFLDAAHAAGPARVLRVPMRRIAALRTGLRFRVRLCAHKDVAGRPLDPSQLAVPGVVVLEALMLVIVLKKDSLVPHTVPHWVPYRVLLWVPVASLRTWRMA